MKIFKIIIMNLFYIPVILFLSVSLNGCFIDDEKKQDARHVPGVYTGTGPYSGYTMTIVAGEEDITRLTVTVFNTGLGSEETIDITGSWPLTWNNDDNAYDFYISATTGSGMPVIVDGLAGIDVDDIPTVQGSVKVNGVDIGPFYLYL